MRKNTLGTSEPARWSDGQGASPLADLIGAAFREVAASYPSRTRRVTVEIAAPEVMPARRRPRLLWALAAALVLGLGGGVLAAEGIVLWRATRLAPQGPGNQAPVVQPSSRHRRTAMRHANPGARVSEDMETSPSETPAAPVPAPAVETLSLPPTPTPPAESEPTLPLAPSTIQLPRTAHRSLSLRRQSEPSLVSRDSDRAVIPSAFRPDDQSEAAIVSRAFRALRAERSPRSALELLDERNRRYPAGKLRAEADLARVEALLGLGRRREALAVLDTMPDGRGEQARDQALLRGELRAEAGRCSEAIGDFARAELRGTGPRRPEIEGRATWGQGSCYARLGEVEHARHYFRLYLRTVSHGATAERARQWLANHPE